MSETTTTKEHRTPYQIYWDCVMGPDQSPESAVQAFDLVPGDLRGFEEWVGEAQCNAVAQGADLDALDCGALSLECARALQEAAEFVWTDAGTQSAEGYMADAVWGPDGDERLPDPATCRDADTCRAWAAELREFAEAAHPYEGRTPDGNREAALACIRTGEVSAFIQKAVEFEERAMDLEGKGEEDDSPCCTEPHGEFWCPDCESPQSENPGACSCGAALVCSGCAGRCSYDCCAEGQAE